MPRPISNQAWKGKPESLTITISHPPCSLPLRIPSLRNSFASMPRELLPGSLVRSDFWFHDGNIVIIAGSAAFKVHRGQLERHSEIFNDLFSIPQPMEQDLIDGCSYVELPDCPSDVLYFLSALYDGLCEFFSEKGLMKKG